MPVLGPRLGYQVTTRQYSLLEMVEREWGSEWAAPDHRIYEFSNGRAFDSTDMGATGIYKKGVIPAFQAIPGQITTDYGAGITTDAGAPIVVDSGAPSPGKWSADSTVPADSPNFTADQ